MPSEPFAGVLKSISARSGSLRIANVAFTLALIPITASAASITLSASTNDSGACAPGTELVDRLPSQPGLDWGLTRSTTDVRAGLFLSTTCGLSQGVVTTMAASGSFGSTLTLGAYASSAIPAGAEPFTLVDAGVDFRDSIVPLGGSLGTAGILRLSFDLHGSTSGGYGQPGWTPSAGNASGWMSVAGQGAVLHGAGALTFDVPVVFGQQRELLITLSARVFGGDAPVPASKLVFADFLHTATLASVGVFDADGIELTNGSVVSDAGLQYGGDPEPVPEPASVLLIGSGLAGLVRRTRRR